MAGSDTLRRPAPTPVPPDYPRTPLSGADFIYGALLLVLLTVAAVGVASMAGVFEDDTVGTNPPVEEPAETVELESTGRIADVGTALWRKVVVPGDGVGWVNAAFLTETAP